MTHDTSLISDNVNGFDITLSGQTHPLTMGIFNT